MDSGVEDGAMPLVIVGAPVVLPEVVGVDRRAEEELTHIVQRLRVGVGDAKAAPSHGPLYKGNVQAIVVGVRQRRILAVVGVVRIRAASVVIPGCGAGGHILIDGNDEPKSAQMLVSGAPCAA